MTAETPNAGMSTCPICKRTWLVTPLDDCMVPYCGCFGNVTESGNRPCERCGLHHTVHCLRSVREVRP